MMTKMLVQYSYSLLVKKVRQLDDRDDRGKNYPLEFVMFLLDHVVMDDNVDSSRMNDVALLNWNPREVHLSCSLFSFSMDGITLKNDCSSLDFRFART